MALVILTHVLRLRREFIHLSPDLLRIIVSFNMPLFALLSGWVLAGREGKSPLRFMKGKALGLLVPYLAWIAVEMPLRHVPPSGYLARLWHALLNPMYGMQMWFLWALFWMFAVFTLGRVVSRSDWWTAALAVAVGCVALFIPGGANGLNRVSWLYPYLIVGYLASKHRATLRRFDAPVTVGAAIAFAGLSAANIRPARRAVRNRNRGGRGGVRRVSVPPGRRVARTRAAWSANPRRLRVADGCVPVPRGRAGLVRGGRVMGDRARCLDGTGVRARPLRGHAGASSSANGLGRSAARRPGGVLSWRVAWGFGARGIAMTEPEGTAQRRVKVMVETAERAIIGYMYRPERGPDFRLSDHLNTYDRLFICLNDAEIKDRGQLHRPGDKRRFIAIAVQAVTFITPLEED